MFCNLCLVIISLSLTLTFRVTYTLIDGGALSCPSLSGLIALSFSQLTSFLPTTAMCSTNVPLTWAAGASASHWMEHHSALPWTPACMYLCCHGNRWSGDCKWPYDTVVEWNTEHFKGEGLQNVAVPCDSSQECFYVSRAFIVLYFDLSLSL